MNIISLKFKLDKILKQEYLQFFNITNPNEYAYFSPKENEIRTQKFINFFINKKESIISKKRKRIKDYLLINLCDEKIEVLSKKLEIMKEAHKSPKPVDFTEVNKELGITSSVLNK